MSKRCEIGRECQRHSGVEHGAEAEELRKAIEEYRDALNRKHGDDAVLDAGDVAWALTVILDRIDARDSLSWLEIRDQRLRRGASADGKGSK